MSVRPTPSQDENDAAAVGQVVVEKEPDGSPPQDMTTPPVVPPVDPPPVDPPPVDPPPPEEIIDPPDPVDPPPEVNVDLPEPEPPPPEQEARSRTRRSRVLQPQRPTGGYNTRELRDGTADI